jgi:methanogenic corrinoid protein MtbC1
MYMSESTRERVFKKLIEAVDLGDEDLAAEGANEALAEEVPPYDAIIHGLAEGMKLVGARAPRSR